MSATATAGAAPAPQAGFRPPNIPLTTLRLALASFMQLVHISTLNWQSFAELAITFTLTPGIALGSFRFAIVMGVVGGFLPAVRAARLKIVDSLRAA